MTQLDELAERIRHNFEEINAIRNEAYERSRHLTSMCARAIRAIHREEWDQAEQRIENAGEVARQLMEDTRPYPEIYHAGYTQDALKEYVEANLTYQFIRDRELLTPQELGTEENTWLNGLAEAATELRRRILDIIRHGHTEEVERLLDKMDEIYSIMVTFDFNDTITGGLRRRTDVLRSVLERTRGDVTSSLRQAELEHALESLEKKISEQKNS